jgi:putative sigma-54 modulation protein
MVAGAGPAHDASPADCRKEELPMRIDIRARRHDLSPEIRGWVHDRVAFGFARMGGALRTVRVSLADANGPRGGIDKVCRVTVRGRFHQPIVVEQRDSRVERAVDAAVDRAERTVVRALERTRR